MRKAELPFKFGHTRRRFLQALGLGALAGALPLAGPALAGEKVRRPPNVLLILTDDQGFGDLGCHGNAKINTPNLDKLYSESTRLTQFHVSPVCSPTRASLLTGRYHFRTGILDTYLGRSMMCPEETTLAQLLAQNGYQTGIFGKWHLGDNYPMRACDRGFHESLVHGAGGIGQPGDLPDNGYFHPSLYHNGHPTKYQGYCTDIFAAAAMAFIEKHKEKPFFAYLSTNCPHTPLVVDAKYSDPYKKKGLDDQTAKVYGMIENIDENVGKIIAKLKALDLEEDTLILFISDNGPKFSKGKKRFNGNLRGVKGETYQGGVRVPCFLKLPGRLNAGQDVPDIAAHIDIAPTVLAACGVAVPQGLHLDGANLWPRLLGEASKNQNRTLFLQWHRGEKPQRYLNCAVRTQRFKLVMNADRMTPKDSGQDNRFELFDLDSDPAEKKNLAKKHPDLLKRLKTEYDAWFDDVCVKGLPEQPFIHIGTPHENPTMLTSQDWRVAGRTRFWNVKLEEDGIFDVSIHVPKAKKGTHLQVRFGDRITRHPLPDEKGKVTVSNIPLEAGSDHLHISRMLKGKPLSIARVYLKRTNL